MMRTYTILLLVTLWLFSSCYNCDCDEGSGLNGFYVCSRRATTNEEFLWLFKDKSYVHVLSYDSVQYINSDIWRVIKDPNRRSLFEAENWVAPCAFERSDCYYKMDVVNKKNVREFKGSGADLHYGCYNGLDDTCYFR